MYFVDESGSIPTFKSTKWKNRYFVIAFVHTNNYTRLKRVYKQYLGNVKKYYPEYIEPSGELKGSAAPPFIKEYLITRLLDKTDINIGYIVADNWNTKDAFREVPERSYNYLVKLLLMSHSFGAQDRAMLTLKVDNRNSAIKSLNSLEDYLYQELVLGEGRTGKVDVEFCLSENNYGVQVADLFANTIMQYHKYKTKSFPNYEAIHGPIDEVNPDIVSNLYNLMSKRLFYSQLFPVQRSNVGVALV
ncbi:DUF3800 domain-containing protein [Brevibacillus sp. AG]|uniref:DUF3800 domain-containing protein n=1 Tax=Brevibacillus sp. AG TaxID=3020891 RepID=UPI00232F8129|nr:DUF3800 domain-containing protein [Brevibacillus sp. AG]MDC0761712.1 DUF3800 domain-containing protein [Brevibacillus sp. AG]